MIDATNIKMMTSLNMIEYETAIFEKMNYITECLIEWTSSHR